MSVWDFGVSGDVCCVVTVSVAAAAVAVEAVSWDVAE